MIKLKIPINKTEKLVFVSNVGIETFRLTDEY